jgi:hypothetical protein
MNKRRQSISRKVSNDSGLRRSLLEGDTLQMTQVHQPKSFFSHEDGQQKADGDETRSVDSEEQESFETSGYSWDFVIVFPIHEPGKGPSVKLEVDEVRRCVRTKIRGLIFTRSCSFCTQVDCKRTYLSLLEKMKSSAKCVHL